MTKALVDQEMKSLACAVFAHNEGALVARCVEELLPLKEQSQLSIKVLVNGTTNGTDALLSEHFRSEEAVEVLSLPLGDKALTWNHFVHNLRPTSDYVAFLDGDTHSPADSILALCRGLSGDDRALAAGGVPGCGLTAKSWTKSIMDFRRLSGALYMLPARTLLRLREAKFFLPAGLIGDDSLLSWSLKMNLEPRGEIDHRLIKPVEDALFYPVPLRWYSCRDFKAYWRKQQRYKIRQDQTSALLPLLRKNGLIAMPERVGELCLMKGES